MRVVPDAVAVNRQMIVGLEERVGQLEEALQGNRELIRKLTELLVKVSFDFWVSQAAIDTRRLADRDEL